MAGNTRKHLRALSFTPGEGRPWSRWQRSFPAERSLKENPLFSVGFTAHGPLRGPPSPSGLQSHLGPRHPVHDQRRAHGRGIGSGDTGGNRRCRHGGDIERHCHQSDPRTGKALFLQPRVRPRHGHENGFAVTGGPENALLAVAGADLARYYRMPSASWMCSDSLLYDAQNALEKSLPA